MRPSTLLTSLITALLGIASLPAAAVGKGPAFFTGRSAGKFGPEEEPLLSKVYGATILVEGKASITVREYETQTEMHAVTATTFTNPDSGEALIERAAATNRFQETVTPDDATITMEIDDEAVGLKSHWSKSGEGVRLFDAGRRVTTLTIIQTLNDSGEVENEQVEQDVQVSGSHPQSSPAPSPTSSAPNSQARRPDAPPVTESHP